MNQLSNRSIRAPPSSPVGHKIITGTVPYKASHRSSLGNKNTQQQQQQQITRTALTVTKPQITWLDKQSLGG